jgi:hypothetical protein
MTAPIEDVSSLPGKKITDQEEVPVGEVKEIFATEDGFPMWVSVELSEGMSKNRVAFIPLARIKDENGDLRVPYSKSKIADSPEVDDSEGISQECDFELRGYYGIGTGDQEMWSDNKGYSTMVQHESSPAERAEDADDLETPDPDQRTEESQERLEDPGSSEIRNVDAEAIAEGKDEKPGDDDEDEDDDEPQGKKDDKSSEDEDEDEDDDEPQGKKDDKSSEDEDDGEDQAKSEKDEGQPEAKHEERESDEKKDDD